MRNPKRLLFIGAESHPGREAIKGVDAYCRRHGQWEFHLEGDSSPVAALRTQIAIDEWKADGIIAFIRSRAMERAVRNSGLPVVNFDAACERNLPTVISDSAAVGRLVARYFLDNGYKNFAFYARNAGELNTRQRWDAYVEELRRRGFDAEVFDSVDQFKPHLWFQSYRRTQDWVASLKKPVAIMSSYDTRAQELMMVCHRLRFRIPDDVAVVGAGNMEAICRMCTPPLSSVDPDMPRIGYEAARLMHRLLRGGKAPGKPILIPPRRIVTRQSSDMIAVDDPDVATALRLIRTHLQQRIGVKDILRQVPICRKTLEQRFEQLIGRPPYVEIVRVRIEHAKDLVHWTGLPIKEVARTMGFASSRKFADFFHRHTKQTPTQYRHSTRQAEKQLLLP